MQESEFETRKQLGEISPSVEKEREISLHLNREEIEIIERGFVLLRSQWRDELESVEENANSLPKRVFTDEKAKSEWVSGNKEWFAGLIKELDELKQNIDEQKQ